MTKTSPSKIHCVENDPGSSAYIRDATPELRAEFDLRAGVGLPNPFPFEHVMIDIETMSLHPHNALILSIGMIEFDPTPINGLVMGKRSLILPNLEQQLLLGREVSTGTQKFWKDPALKAASDHWANADGARTNLALVCQRVSMFCEGRSHVRVWANGTQFDLSNLVELNRQLGDAGQEALWHYQAPRDMRTFCRETPATRLSCSTDETGANGVPHEPVYDCINQAWQVWAHWDGS
jgi:hypothetical protein